MLAPFFLTILYIVVSMMHFILLTDNMFYIKIIIWK